MRNLWSTSTVWPNYHTYQPLLASGIFTKSQGTLEKTLLTTCLPNQPGQHFLTSCKVLIDSSRTFFDTKSSHFFLWLHRESHLHNSWFQMHNFTKFNPFRNKVCKILNTYDTQPKISLRISYFISISKIYPLEIPSLRTSCILNQIFNIIPSFTL